MELEGVTVGQLRAELIGWPDDVPVVVLVPDVRDPMTCTMRPLAAAGVPALSDAAAVLGTWFPLSLNAPGGR